jgi:hypothetical protein
VFLDDWEGWPFGTPWSGAQSIEQRSTLSSTLSLVRVACRAKALTLKRVHPYSRRRALITG